MPDFSQSVDELYVEGDPEIRLVEFHFCEVELLLGPAVARELAFALMTAADRAERREVAI